MNSNIPSRMMRDAAAEQDRAEDLAEFVVLLLDALEIPEVRDRVKAALATQPAPKPAASGRTTRRTR